MGKLVELSDGYFLLEVRIGSLSVIKIFKEVEKPMDQISRVPMPDGFYLHIIDDMEKSDKDR